MSIGILILSVIFAAVQVGIGYVAFAYEPIAEFFESWPAWAMTGCLFAVGMLLSFILILIIGSLKISRHAADFVRDHFGRAIALLLISILFVSGIAVGGEFVYQIEPTKREEKPKVINVYSDILYVLDTSSSMSWAISGTSTIRSDVMKEAFKRNLDEMKDGQYISVIFYNSTASVRKDWAKLDSAERNQIISLVEREEMMGGTDFTNALTYANRQVKKSIDAGRDVEVIMISDGEDKNVNIAECAPDIKNNGVRVHTIMIGQNTNADHLRHISNSTGGTFNGSSDTITSLVTKMKQITEQATKKVVVDTGFTIKDTLTTPREERSAIIPAMILRILLLFIICFVFKLITNICIGNNRNSMGSHLLLSFIIALISALAVEFGYVVGLPLIAVTGILWVLMMSQIVITDR